MSPDSSDNGTQSCTWAGWKSPSFFLHPTLFTTCYSLAKLLTTSKHINSTLVTLISSSQLDFSTIILPSWRPRSRNFAQIQSKINSILCCVLIEMLFVHFQDHLFKFSYIIFPLFTQKREMCLLLRKDEIVPHFLNIISTLNYFILWKHTHGENSKGTNEYKISGWISKTILTQTLVSLAPEATCYQVFAELFYAYKRIHIFLYFNT